MLYTYSGYRAGNRWCHYGICLRLVEGEQKQSCDWCEPVRMDMTEIEHQEIAVQSSYLQDNMEVRLYISWQNKKH